MFALRRKRRAYASSPVESSGISTAGCGTASEKVRSGSGDSSGGAFRFGGGANDGGGANCPARKIAWLVSPSRLNDKT